MKLRLGQRLNAFDARLTQTVLRLPRSFGPFMHGVSLASLPPVGMAGLAALLGFMVMLGYQTIALAVVFIWAGAALVEFTKRLVHRTRPDTVYVSTRNPRGYSFPSGHAADALLVYGFVAYLAARYITEPWAVVVIALCTVFIFLSSLSRVWLGAHFPSDVIGGWVIGGGWLLLTLALLRP